MLNIFKLEKSGRAKWKEGIFQVSFDLLAVGIANLTQKSLCLPAVWPLRFLLKKNGGEWGECSSKRLQDAAGPPPPRRPDWGGERGAPQVFWSRVGPTLLQHRADGKFCILYFESFPVFIYIWTTFMCPQKHTAFAQFRSERAAASVSYSRYSLSLLFVQFNWIILKPFVMTVYFRLSIDSIS